MTQEEALELLKMGHNIFLTGPAGSGKTFVLNRYREWLDKKNIPVALTASTGIAATHIGGITIHSWSGMGIKERINDYDLENLLEKKYLHDRLKETIVLIIDEISMLSSAQLESVEKITKSFRSNDLPFGGLQVVFSGDFMQLPPISTNSRPHFAYESSSWKNGRIKPCYLSTQHRQTDDGLLRVLSALREEEIDEEVYEILMSRYRKPTETGVPPARLFTHNEDVDAINERELSLIVGLTKVYGMSGRGSKKLQESLARSILAPERLSLKVGARVMFVRNNFDLGFVNGTMGVVDLFDRMGMPVVKLASGKKITVAPEVWRIDEDGKTKAEVSQLPLRLAWAITIHKSQGMSLDALEVDLSRAFVPGMGYVALSRVRSLKGLNILGLNNIALRTDRTMAGVEASFRDMSSQFARGLSLMSADQKQKIIDKFISESARAKKAPKISTYDETKKMVEEGITLADMAKRRKLTEETIIAHLEKLVIEFPNLNLDYLKPAPNRLQKIKEAFKKTGDTKLSAVKSILPISFSFKDIRLGRLFLDEK
ncbi:MAG: helix-turn-helix domain-containing protein [Patescibacteria group bacterium]